MITEAISRGQGMAKGGRGKKGRKREKLGQPDNRGARIVPTDERAGRQETQRMGMATRLVPVIDTMLKRDQITPQEHLLLSYYRSQALLADRSEVKSCLDFSVKGGDIAPPAAITSAILETARIERDLGSLRPLARAVVVDDKTLTQWCIDQYGCRERYDGNGKFVALVPLNEVKAMQMAKMELRMAARKIVR
jgi:hypothetical protein